MIFLLRNLSNLLGLKFADCERRKKEKCNSCVFVPLSLPACVCIEYDDLNRSESLPPSSALPSGNAALLALQAAAVRVG